MANGPEIIGGDAPKGGPDLMDMKGKIRDLKEEVREEAARFDQDATGQADAGLHATTATQDNANVIYILYLVNIVVPFLGIVGVIMAYSARDRAPAGLRSHYDNQIRIFWTTLIAYAVSFVLVFILIGILTGLLVTLWKVVRVATGMSLLSQGKAVGNAQSLAFTSEPQSPAGTF